ncbi:hypothetical protein C8Q77DRAFT_1048857 [Trametes polyzona]|nr:hypothetical protein C8Q77DRAFT_1048857 [Trametes polyzona]
MTSSLEEGLLSGRLTAQDALAKRQAELDAEEADIADSRVRYEAERLLDFYDELGDAKVAEEVASMILRFKTVERGVNEAASQALRLTSLPLDDTTHITQYTTLLDTLDLLEMECQDVQEGMQSLERASTRDERRLTQVLGNIADIVRGYAESVRGARRVVESCRENYRMGIGTLTLK